MLLITVVEASTTYAAILTVVETFPTYANTISISSSDEATSCEDPTGIHFRCGSYHLGPGWGYVPGVGDVVQKAAVEFSLDGVNSASGNISATLQLQATGFSPYFSNDPVLEIHGYAGNGVVELGDLSTNNLLLTTQPITYVDLYVFDVTDFVTQLLNDNAGYAGFALRDIIYNSAVSFGSPPVPVPVPPALWLFGSGLLGLLTLTRMKAA